MKQLIFVYGTLKKGMINHFFLANQNYIGIAQTNPIYELHGLADYPALIDTSHPDFQKSEQFSIFPPGKAVYGEIYEVDSYCLQLLDEFEGVQQGLYRRGNVSLAQIFPVNLPTTSQTAGQLIDKAAQTYFYLSNLERNLINFWPS